MASRKRARQREERRGVFWRDVTKRWVVEMRPHNFKKKLNFGSYKAKQEAMVARDYGAHLRYLAGEKAADAGGFDQYHQSIYEFKQSPIIFEAIEELRSRLDEYQRLIPLCQQPKGRLGKESPQKKFCEAARKDIEVAIKQFQASHPHLLATSLCTEARRDVPSVGETPCIPLASNPEIRVSPEPTPERESGAVTGHDASIWKDVLETAMSVTISIITGDGFQSSLFKTEVSLLHREQVFRIIESFIDRERITAALTEATLDKFFENLPPCLIEPTSIPAIDVPEDDPKT